MIDLFSFCLSSVSIEGQEEQNGRGVGDGGGGGGVEVVGKRVVIMMENKEWRGIIDNYQ